MMATYCEIVSGLVANTSEWDGVTPWSPPGTWVQSDVAQIGWSYDGSTFTAPVVVPPSSPPPDVASTIILSSVARLAVADGDVSGVDLSANIGAALYLGVGNYMLFFNNSEPDTSYLVRGFLDGFVVATDQETDSFMVQCTDRTGTAFDPATLQIETLRVQ